MVLLTKSLSVVGPINAQFAIQQNDIFVLEVNPRASRTVPFVSKSIGLSLAKIGALCMVNKSLSEQGIADNYITPFFFIKVPIFSFHKFPGVDPMLGPEMRSTGEIMGIGKTTVPIISTINKTKPCLA